MRFRLYSNNDYIEARKDIVRSQARLGWFLFGACIGGLVFRWLFGLLKDCGVDNPDQNERLTGVMIAASLAIWFWRDYRLPSKLNAAWEKHCGTLPDGERAEARRLTLNDYRSNG